MLPVLPSPYDSVAKKDRVIRVIGGDDIVFSVVAMLNQTPCTPDNSIIRVCLADTRHSELSWWEGGWRCGAEVVNNGIQGLVVVTIPHEVADTLREGSYAISVSVSDKLGNTVKTVGSGSLQLEYAATSPHHSIPYRDGSILLASAAADQIGFVWSRVDVEAGASSVDIPISAGYALASAPILVAQDSSLVWITDVVPTATGATVYFGSAIPEEGWGLSYVLLEVPQ